MPPFRVISEFQPTGDQPQAIDKLVQGLEAGNHHQVLLGVTGSGKTFTMAKVIERVQRPALIIAHNKTLAAQLYSEMREFMPDNAVEYFVSYYDYYQPEAFVPATNTYIEKDAIVNDVIDRMRLSATRSLFERKDVIIIASVSCIYGLGSAEAYYGQLVMLEEGDRIRRDALLRKLVKIQYKRNDVDFQRGTFRVRGDTVDIFPAYEEMSAVRVEFFGDEIDQIRAFSVADQRSLPEVVEHVAVVPSRELLLTDAVRARAREMQGEFPSLAGMLEKISEGIPVDGMESLTPALTEGLVPLTQYMPAGAAVALLDPERAVGRAITLGETNREFLSAAWSAATAGAQAPIDLSGGDFLSLPRLRESGAQRGGVWWTLSTFDSGAALGHGGDLAGIDLAGIGLGGEGVEDPAADASDALTRELTDDPYVRVSSSTIPSFHGNVDGATAHIGQRIAEGWAVVVAAPGIGLLERARDVLAERGIGARIVDTLDAAPETGVVHLVVGEIEAGFESAEARLSVLTESDFYGRTISNDSRVVKKLASRRKNVVDPLQLKAGDFVVHQTHGIGKFVELVQREVSSGGRHAVKSMREYLVVEYAPSKRGYPGDKLFVPTDQLDLLSRYVGGEAPGLSKMGGSDWAQAKGKARKAVRDIAVELVKLYSARMSAKGHAFGPDTPWQRELEEAFPFAETHDQLQTIDEVKADMERPIPMDRLLAGDVGFGKTEVAVRAAFKAIQDGKQVAMLVPTTLLVKQHHATVSERFAGFPVRVRALSRFQSDREAREIVKGLADGSVDMVIGTHRILTEKVIFKDLGLMIIDEEQRF
ncbi:MAG: DEAD/DEAH box helicase, partial [Caldilineaceae bacterium]|nr:DEAD/DEAH box helicase [Caldilineaceae bacterium]